MTALWLSWFDESGEHHETKLADPRELLGATADSEDVPAEEKARRERAREGGTGIVGYSADDDGNRIVFTINGRLFLTDIDWNDETGAPEPHTRELAGEWLDEDPAMYTPVLNPRIAPDGEHVLYTTGSYLMLVDIGGELGDRITAVYGVSVEDEDGQSGRKHVENRSGRVRGRRRNGPVRRFLVGPGFAACAVRVFRHRRRADLVHQRSGRPREAGRRPPLPARADPQRRRVSDRDHAGVR